MPARKKRAPRPIAVPAAKKPRAKERTAGIRRRTVSRSTGEPVSRSTKQPSGETAWENEGASDGAPSGIYRDPNHKARYHRQGRGGREARAVRRITVYVSDDLARAMDIRIATHVAADGSKLSRSDLVEEALRAHLEALDVER